jgi:hypothetical protein
VDLNGISSETLEAIKKSATTGMTVATGLQGYDLRDVISLVPAPSSFYSSLAHSTPEQGSDYATWRVMMNINNQQANPATAFDAPAPLHKNSLITVSAAYAKLGYGYTVTKDAIAKARGFADAKAIEVYGSMNLYKVGADKMSLYGSNIALGTPGTPTVTQADTGGSIAASTAVNVKVAARTGTNYSYGGSTAASAQGTVTTSTVAAATHSAVAKVAAVRGAVAYDWFVAGFYYTTTVVNQVTITSIPTANQAGPTNLPGLYATAPTAVPATDSSANALEFNGLLATLAGDYATGGASGLVQAGSGLASGASFTSLDGAGFTGSGQTINELDALNTAFFNNTFMSPSAYMCSSVDASKLSTLILGSSGGGTTFFTPGSDGRGDITAGGFVAHYINKATGGTPVRIEVHPNMVPGTLIARTDHVNFPNSNISNVFELRDLEGVQDYEYGVSRGVGVGGGPRFDGEVYSSSVLVNRAPICQAVLANIGG